MYTYVNGTGVVPGVVFQQVEFIGLDGQVFDTLPLQYSDLSTLYNTSIAMPPSGYFYVKVSYGSTSTNCIFHF